jgi:hypothetical protein
VPLLDFCNHASSVTDARLDLVPDPFAKTLGKHVERGPLQWQLDRNVTAGEQLFFDYGPHSSLQWLLSFGWEPPSQLLQGDAVVLSNSSGHELALSWSSSSAELSQLRQSCRTKQLPSSDEVRWRALLPRVRHLLSRCSKNAAQVETP